VAINVNGYGSRKFIVTLLGMFLCAGIAVLAMFLKVEPSAAALLGIGAGITAYNWANVRHNNGSTPE
jgi:hypothetical protein